MVLGENGIAYGGGSASVTAFDLTSGASLWTYSQPLNIVAALSGGGLLVNTNSGLVTLDASGAPVASSGTLVGSPTPRAIDDWAGVLNNSFGDFSGPTTSFAINEYSFPAGDPQGQHRPGTPVPTSLRVVSSNIIAPTSFNSPCDPLIEYQIAIAVRYQILDQYQEPLTHRLMIPQEKLLANTTNGFFNGDADPEWVDIGPTQFTGTSRFADANGQFVDAPFGLCASAPFDSTETQEISILVDGKNHLVRSSKWTIFVGPFRHGIITNGTDITKTF